MRYGIAFIFLLILALIRPAAYAADEVALIVGGQKMILNTPPVLVDGAVYAPLAALDAVGAKYKRDGKKVKITSAGGKTFSCNARLIGEEPMLPIRDIAPELGAVADWDEVSRNLSIRARIESIEFDGTELRVTTSYPVAYESSWWKGANKLILDLHGVHTPARQSDLPIKNSTAISIRTGSHDGGETGRIVLDLPAPIKHEVKSPGKASKIIVSISGLSPADSTGRAADAKAAPSPEGKAEPPAIELPPVSITDIGCREQGSNRIEVYATTSGSVKYTTYMLRRPDRLVLDISNATLARPFAEIDVRHDLLQAIRIGQRGKDTVRIAMDLTRVAAFDVRQYTAPGRLVIGLQFPKNAGGLFADKIVIIDPGHGGEHSGCRGISGQPEKYHTLEIAKQVCRSLENAGACALMTRDSDVGLDPDTKTDLIKRTDYARRHSADFFISIHCNSCQLSGSASGTETFYHRGDASGRALAQCIHAELVEAIGLPDREIKPDPGSGFIVLLRSSQSSIPAALIEVGFLDNPRDVAKITDPAVQQRVAEAVVRGLRAYVEGNSRPITRTESAGPDSDPADAEPAPSETDAAPKGTDEPAADTQKPISTTGPHRPGERYK